MTTKALVFLALKFLHSIDNDPGVIAALAAAEKSDTIDWTGMLAAIGHAVYGAAGSPSIATIIQIIMSFAHPTPVVNPPLA